MSHVNTKSSSKKEKKVKNEDLTEKIQPEIIQEDPKVAKILNNKLDDINNDTSFILKSNKTTGNYTILRKGNANTVQRVKYTIYNAYLPFGKEIYKDNIIFNVVIDDSTNLNHNLLVTMNRITKTFDELKNNETVCRKYSLNGKKYFPFIKETGEKEINNETVKEYSLRLYCKYGAKVTHSKYPGELSYDQLKGKRCKIDVELGSLWVSEQTHMYGINVHVTHITVYN